jgi:oligopeptide transport system substrate-binding protein
VDYNGTKVAYGDMPIGNGPFKMAEPWKHNEYVRVARNDDYWGDKALLDTVLFKIFKDTNTEYLEFEAGNLDFSIIGEGQIAQAKAKYGEAPDGYTGEPGKQCILGAQSGVYYANFLTTDPVLKNVDLRRAISLAINRQAISDTVFDGTRTPADNFVPPGIAGYEAGVWVDSKYDVEAAKAALEKAGYPGGKGCPELKLWFNVDGGHQPVWELVQSDLKAIGIPSKLSPTADFATYLKELDAGKVQVGRLGWLSDYPTADNYLYSMFYSKSGDNKSKYNNPAVDKALVEARAITDTAARVAAYQEINKTIQADMPVAPIMFYRHHNVTSDRLHGFTYDAFQYGTFEKAWLTNGGK